MKKRRNVFTTTVMLLSMSSIYMMSLVAKTTRPVIMNNRYTSRSKMNALLLQLSPK